MIKFWKTLGWVIPYRFYRYADDRFRLRKIAAVRHTETKDGRKLAAPNNKLRNRHISERCFILCNGPSVTSQNLLVLAGETVISVSHGYLHPDFKTIRPRYHCVPQITYGLMTEEHVVDWFKEMHEHLGDAELFLSTTEEPLVRTRGLFKGRTVHYIFLHSSFDEIEHNTIPDLADIAPRVETVSVMCTMIAMFLGFDRIFLLGTDHDQFKTGTYTHFYDDGVIKGLDPDVGTDGKVLTSHYDEFNQLLRLWKQYRALRKIATANGIAIVNSTAGGELDEFPRMSLENILRNTNQLTRPGGKILG